MLPAQIITAHQFILKQLDVWRKRAEFARAFQAQLLTDLRLSDDWKKAETVRVDAEARRDQLEGSLRHSALESFEATGDKHPYLALDVREMTEINYDENRALEYCKANPNMQGALKLDRAKFEKAAIALGLDFVTTSKAPRATISSNLGRFIEPSTIICTPVSHPNSLDKNGKIDYVILMLEGKQAGEWPVDSPQWQVGRDWVMAEIANPNSAYSDSLLMNMWRGIIRREAEVIEVNTTFVPSDTSPEKEDQYVG
jgi:hypothetical protein